MMGFFAVQAKCRSKCGRQDILPFAVKAVDAEQAELIVRGSIRVGSDDGDVVLSVHPVTDREYAQLWKGLRGDVTI